MRFSITLKIKNYTDINNKESTKDNNSSEKNKGNYYFNSTFDRFNEGIFDNKNKNPGY